MSAINTLRERIAEEKPVKKTNKGSGKREPLFGVVVGKKGVGKTFTTLKQIKRYVYESKFPRRTLIFDVNNEFGQFRSISLRNIKRWCDSNAVEVRRVSIFKAMEDLNLTVNGKPVYFNPHGKMTLNEMANALYYILNNYYNGLLLIEDINKYVSDSLPSDLIGAICTQRHIGVDVIIHFQNVGRFGHPKIISNANWLRFHKVTDKVIRHESKFGAYTEPLSIVEKIVDSKYNKSWQEFRDGIIDEDQRKAGCSAHVFFDNDELKIKGDFTRDEFVEAIISYLSENASKLVNPKLKEQDLFTGKLKYPDRAALIKTLIEEYSKDYYGNPN
jgi:hypothetical protein